MLRIHSSLPCLGYFKKKSGSISLPRINYASICNFQSGDKSMKRIGVALVASMLSFGGATAFADYAKIGVVDLQKIMQTSPQMKTIQQKLEADFKPRRDKL